MQSGRRGKASLRGRAGSRQDARYLRFVLDSVRDYAIFTIDQRGVISSWNAGAQKVLGYAESEIIGRSADVLFTPEDQAADVPRRERRAASDRNRAVDERWHVRKGGERFWASGLLFPLKDERGRPHGFAKVMRDETDRRLSERAIRESENLLMLVINSVPALLSYIDKDQRFVFTNRRHEEWFSRPSADFKGRSLLEVFGGAAYDALRPHVEAALAGESVTFESEVSYHAGDMRWIRAVYIPDFGDDRGVCGFVALVFDITDRKRAEETLRKSEQEVKELNRLLEQRVRQRTMRLMQLNDELEAFSYSIAHDLRAPLRQLSGFSEALLEDYSARLDDKGRHYVLTIHQASQRMGKLISELLDLSLVTRRSLRREPVDLSRLANAIAGDLSRAEPARKVRFDIQPGLEAEGDPSLLETVMRNLLENAWKFTGTRDQATIAVGGQRSGEECVFFVRDDGVGFDMAFAEKLFHPFQTLHDRRSFVGSGVGLASVQRVVQRHGGRVWAESELGRGATFYFTLRESHG